jgi:hypothetical protein
MKVFGSILICVGVIYLLIAFNMNVSVSTSSTYVPGYGSIGGGDVANLDLMAQRQNHLIVAALITLVGAMMTIFGKDESEPRTVNDTVPSAPTPLDFVGERDLSSDSYRLWLAKHHKIDRNEVFDRFILGERSFSTLDEALAHAHGLEVQKVEDAAAAQERRDAQIATEKEARQAATEKAEAEWQETKPKVIVGLVIFVALIAGGYLLFRETPEERATRLVREEAERVEEITNVEKRFEISLPKDAAKIRITENAADYDFLCDDRTNGTLLTFETSLKKEEVKDGFAKSLGKGTATYYLGDNFDWEWSKNKVHFELSMFDDNSPIEVNLCRIE